MTEPADPKPYHHGDVREAALAEALRRIAAEGGAALSLRDIAKAVGVTHRALYRHFADKDALMRAIAAVGFRRLGARLEAAAKQASGAPSRHSMDAYIGFALAEPRLYEAMFRLPASTLMTEPEPGDAVRAVLALSATAFAAPGQSSAQVRDRVIAAWGMAHGLCDLWRAGALRARTAADAHRYILDRLIESGIVSGA